MVPNQDFSNDNESNNKSKQDQPKQNFSDRKNIEPVPSTDRIDPNDLSGSDEDSYKAATHSTESETHTIHPTEVPHPREEVGRKVENSTKH